MLRGIPTEISPDLLHALACTGHGDLIVIAEDFYPPYSKSPNATTVFCKGNTAAEMVDAILKLLWHSGIIETLYDRTVFVTTCGAIMMVVAYVCTNMLMNKNVLRSVELLSKGRFVTSLSLAARAEREEGSLHDGGGGPFPALIWRPVAGTSRSSAD